MKSETKAIKPSQHNGRPLIAAEMVSMPMIALGKGGWVKHGSLPPDTSGCCLVVDGYRWVARGDCKRSPPASDDGAGRVRRPDKQANKERLKHEKTQWKYKQ